MALLEVGEQVAIDPTTIVCIQWYGDTSSSGGGKASVRIDYKIGERSAQLCIRCADDLSAAKLYQGVLEAISKEGQAQ